MDLEKLLGTKKFLEDIATSVQNIVFSSFPGMTPQEKEDIEQEVKLKLWRKVARGKKIDNLRSFLWKIVYTTTLDALDERIRLAPPEEIQKRADSLIRSQGRPESPEFLMETKERKALLLETVETLPVRRKTVIQLWLLDMNLEEIAGFLGWNENQVRHLLYRGIQDLKAALNGPINQRNTDKIAAQ